MGLNGAFAGQTGRARVRGMTIQPRLRPIPASLIALALASTPALADVSYSVGGRFGVSYREDPTRPGGQMMALYEGRYTTSYSHQADNGLRFRFDVSVVVGNLPDDNRLSVGGVSAGVVLGED